MNMMGRGCSSRVESTEKDNWVPLVSILRDTLGDNIAENNRLRYVWPLTYTRPTTKQKLAAAIPFFYARIGNKEKLNKVPPAAIDLAARPRHPLAPEEPACRARSPPAR